MLMALSGAARRGGYVARASQLNDDEQKRRVTGGQTPAVHSLEDIGEHLRAARMERHISLREMARRIEVSPSFVSQVELGKAKPSLGTLYSFLSELGLSLDELMPSAGDGSSGEPEAAGDMRFFPLSTNGVIPWQPPASPVLKADSRRMVQLTGVTWERLTSHDDPLVDFLHVTYEPQAESCPREQLMRHSGIEYGMVTEGRLTVQIGFEVYELQAGDSISFDSGTPHRLSNDGHVTCTSVWVVVGRRFMPSGGETPPHHAL